MPHFLTPWLRETGHPWAMRNTRTDAVVATRLEAAFDSTTRRRGLMGRDGIAEGTALVLAPCSAIHTAFMRFPIDVVFVRRDGRVLKVCAAVRPWRMRMVVLGFAVIELAPGSAARAGLARGDVVELWDGRESLPS